MKNTRPYEISIWEDRITYVLKEREGENSIEVDDITDRPTSFWEQYSITNQYLKERKIAIIGSNTMNNDIMAFEPKFKQEVSGNFSLSFKMAYKYRDEITGKLVDNPYIKFLINERKIKLWYKNKWFDLLIKEVSENSEDYIFKYTANALFINELSKTGNSVELDTELENNVGTITELASKVLDGSGWTVDPESEILHSYNEEQLYEAIIGEDIEAYKIDFSTADALSSTPITIKSGSKIYCYFSSLTEEDIDFQILFQEDEEKGYEIDDDHIITNADNYIIKDFAYDSEVFARLPDFISSYTFCDKRGKRTVRKPETKFLPKLGEMVEILKDENDEEVLCYKEEEYVTSSTVETYCLNTSQFLDREYWYELQNETKLTMVPSAETNNTLQVEFCAGGSVLNKSLSSPSILDSFENGIKAGQKFGFSIRVGSEQEAYIPNTLNYEICTYKLQNEVYTKLDTIFSFTPTEEDFNDDNLYLASDEEYTNFLRYSFAIESLKTYTKEELENLKDNEILLGLFINSSIAQTISIEEIYLFDYIIDEAGTKMIMPDDIITGFVKTKYYYFKENDNKEVEDVEDLNLLWPVSYESRKDLIPKFNKDCEKVRTITTSESNRFNIIQDLCELFECWAVFEIQHDERGAIALDENYRPIKKVKFKEYVGDNNYIGFKYGINLKSITREVQSDTIITKMIVKDNSNEFGEDGFCSIARASENPTKTNFLLDFSYYTNQLLLDYNALQADLYSTGLNTGSVGYIVGLTRANKEKKDLIYEQSNLQLEAIHIEAEITVNEGLLENAEAEIQRLESGLLEVTGKTWEEIKQLPENDPILKQSYVIQAMASIPQQRIISGTAQSKLQEFKDALYENKDRQEEIENKLTEISDTVQTLTEDFNQKYYQYVQEGTWISEDYYDDNLYYFDSLSTLATSAKPQITYTIDVLDISPVEGFENYNYEIGDKTFMEDTMFFGWTVVNGAKTPRKEEVIISEIEWDLDNPDQTKITIQNYKTQFEDLFQRITATTTAVEYSTGKYEKVSQIVDTNGNIKPSVLEFSMINNDFIISNAGDESVVIDDQGITTTNLFDQSKAIRIISGGIFLTKDGGQTWSTGITGSGINANYLTTGRVDTSVVTVGNSSYPHFRWDKDGISAYKVTKSSLGDVNYDFRTFVRLDQYGLYGIKGNENFVADSEQSVIESAPFSLTWSGFRLKTTDGGIKGIEITSENDFRVLGVPVRREASAPELIKIGRLDQDNVGIRISDLEGNSVLETGNRGSLWLKNRLDISSTDNLNTVAIGYLGKTGEESYARVFEAGSEDNPNFIIWEDGSVSANNGTFKGHIEATSGSFKGHVEATSGSIGGVQIQAIQSLSQKVVIESNKGFILNEKGGYDIILTAKLISDNQDVADAQKYDFTWFIDGIEKEDYNQKTLSLDMTDFDKKMVQVEIKEKEEG